MLEQHSSIVTRKTMNEELEIALAFRRMESMGGNVFSMWKVRDSPLQVFGPMS
jgi:hypothetical protein